jgi:hypothetical protein
MLGSQEGRELSAERRARLIVPIAWVHVPKTGTSILNTFYHTPVICPTFLADNYVSASEGEVRYWDHRTWGDLDVVCARGFSKSYGFASQWYADAGFEHAGIGGLTGDMFKLNRGHFVTMLRQPEQRLISQYNHYGPHKLLNGSDNRFWPYKSSYPSLREYAEWNAGCAVRQLTMDVGKPFGFLPLPTSQNVSDAIRVLREGFVFVGITEEWALSVCLFRAMFGGQCVRSDLLDTRPGQDTNSSGYDTSELYGWVDVWDGALYADAVSMFDSTRNMYGVDAEWCTSFCQDQFAEPR